MVKVNGEEVEWDRAPNFVNNTQRKVLWKDEKTGATFAIMRIPKGVYTEAQMPHRHPHSGQFTFRLSGEMELPNGTKLTFSEGDYGFGYTPKNEEHAGAQSGIKVNEDFVYLHYWDGPDDWGNSEGEE